MGFIVALISGALMSIQGVFNMEVTKQTSLWYQPDGTAVGFAVCVLPGAQDGKVAALWQVDNKYTLLGSDPGRLFYYSNPEYGPLDLPGGNADRYFAAGSCLCN